MWDVLFMGTPDFAVGSLKALLEAGQYNIRAVVTQPDRPKGRGKKPAPSILQSRTYRLRKCSQYAFTP